MADNAVNFWAHMLDEAFDKSSTGDEPASNSAPLPKDEDTKFKLSDVFTDDVAKAENGVEKVLDAIWPKWFEYFDDAVEKKPRLSIEGQQRDVDDWDVWEIDVVDCYGDVNNMADLMIEHITDGDLDMSKTMSLRELVDAEIERMCDEASPSLDTLKQHGRLTYRGTYKTGGHYPDH